MSRPLDHAILYFKTPKKGLERFFFSYLVIGIAAC